jgi:putative glutamine amidotransferase
MLPLIGIPCAGNVPTRSGYRRFAVGQPYCRALFLAGAAPLLIPLLEDEGWLANILARVDGLLLSGGGDVDPLHYGHQRLTRLSSADRPRDRVELFLARKAYALDIPILGICRGMQLLNVALGGTLVQDITRQRPSAGLHDFHDGHPRDFPAHPVHIQQTPRLPLLVGARALPVNSLHHQCVDQVAGGLLVAAVAPDGIPEAVEAPDKRFVLGVQWHPEELVDSDPRHRQIFEHFVAAANKSPRAN